jgi:hypothetical protein
MGIGRGRPGGNPVLEAHRRQSKGSEPNNVKLALWITQTMSDQLKELGMEKNEFVRMAIATALKERTPEARAETTDTQPEPPATTRRQPKQNPTR